MKIKDIMKLFRDCKIEIDSFDFETIWRGDCTSLYPLYLQDCDIIDVTVYSNFILIRIDCYM